MFEGYNVLVTGATSGIGLGIAKEFLDNGAKVLGIGRDFSRIGEDLGPNFIPCKCDLSDEQQIIDACKMIEEKMDGKLDVMVSNAGSSFFGGPENITSEKFYQGCDILLLAGVLLTKYTLPYLRKSNNPSICYISSMGAYVLSRPQDDSAFYDAFKMALNVYSCQAAEVLPPIRVNTICPGMIYSNIIPKEGWVIASSPEQLKDIPCNKIGEPRNIAKTVAFIASEKGRYITGNVLRVDGGWYMAHPRATI